MAGEKNSRRGFMKAASVAFAGAAVNPSIGSTAENASKAGAYRTYDVTSFGAKGDGKTVDTPSINKAIEAAASAGGGSVVFPAGTYPCYSIRLKSHVELALSSGSVIVGADSQLDKGGPGYDLAESNAPWESFQDFGHNQMFRSAGRA